MDDQSYLVKRRMEIGRNIRQVRKQVGLTQEQAAELLGCSRARVNRVEQGYTEFGIAELELLADRMQIPFRHLVTAVPQIA
jgi:transcriptional regulator with XRE-family HTH domain